jgi:hypothetical protein
MKSKDQGTAKHNHVSTKNDYARIIQKLIEGIDMDSDLERKKAFNKCVEYAEKELKDKSDYNYFVAMAAKMLGQPPIFKDITASIQTKGDEKLYLFYNPSHGPELCGNESGLSYLSEILTLLSKSKLDVDHVHLDHILYGNSYPLTIWKERDTWFKEHATKKESEPEKPIPRRDLNPSEIKALLFPVPMPPPELLTKNKLYKIISVEKYQDQKVWEKAIRQSKERMFVFKILDDVGNQVSFAFDLDDTAVLFFTQGDLVQLYP